MSIPTTRDVIRGITRDFHETSYGYPIVFFSLSLAVYIGGLVGIGFSDFYIGKLMFGMLIGLAAGKLFVIGHDACHDSFTPNTKLNGALGKCSLMMSFHLPAAWRFWHNVVHHGFTNDLSKDFVWRPLSKYEYENASALRRRLEKIYRLHLGVGLGAYYFIEILGPKMLISPRHRQRPDVTGPIGEAWVFYCIHILIITWLVMGHNLTAGEWLRWEEIIINLLFGYVGPVAYVCYALGFVVYFNHTHPEIKWDGDGTGVFADHQISATLYLKFQGISEFLLPSEVMGHAAHHLDTKIPVRKLQKAQQQLVSKSALPINIEIWSWAFQRRVMKHCKLYEPAEHLWTAFDEKSGKETRKDA